MVKYCPRCGTPNNDDAQFCIKCGYQFPQPQQQTPQQQISQQPYTAIPPPIKKSRKTTWIVVGVVIVVLVVIIAAIGFMMQSGSLQPQVQVTAVDMSIQYTGLTSGYLGPTSQSLNGFTTNAGSQFTYSITFTSSAALLSHQINQIYINTPGFTLDSISPPLPYSFSPGSTFTITLVITVPSSSYIGALNIIVSTS